MNTNIRKPTKTGFFQKFKDFGFILPEEREENERDYFVSDKNMGTTPNHARVEFLPLPATTGKKQEARIIRILPEIKKESPKKYVQWIFSYGKDGLYGFIDVEGMKKWLFVYGKNTLNACDGDLVKAEVKTFQKKTEAVVVEILTNEDEIVQGIYTDHKTFGFVTVQNGDSKEDIFIPWLRKNGAQTGDKVEVNILKRSGKNPEGAIRYVIEEDDEDDFEITYDDKF